MHEIGSCEGQEKEKKTKQTLDLTEQGQRTLETQFYCSMSLICLKS